MRTPLNAVIGLSGLLDRDAADPGRVRSYSRKIKASGQHLLTLVNEVLDMSKIDSGRTQLNLSPFSLSELLEGLTFVFQPQAQEKGQRLKINAFGVPQERLIGDQLRLNEVLGNLLSNAIKYTHPGGEVTLAVEQFQSKPAGYYDGVLMDIQMPEMNGYEAARAIRSLNHPDAADIPIVAMTANTFAEDVQKSVDAGMNAHLAKPLDPVILNRTLSGLVKLRGARKGNRR